MYFDPSVWFAGESMEELWFSVSENSGAFSTLSVAAVGPGDFELLALSVGEQKSMSGRGGNKHRLLRMYDLR